MVWGQPQQQIRLCPICMTSTAGIFTRCAVWPIQLASARLMSDSFRSFAVWKIPCGSPSLHEVLMRISASAPVGLSAQLLGAPHSGINVDFQELHNRD